MDQTSDTNPLQKWQNEHGYSDFDAAGKLGILLKRFLELKTMGVAIAIARDEAEGERLAKGTGIADIADQLQKWALKQVPRPPRVIPPNQ